MLNTIAMADEYFKTSFWGSDIWKTLSEDDKTNVLTTSENDVNAILGTANIDSNVIKETQPFSAYQVAVFEWAIYLFQNKDKIKSAITNRMGGFSTVEIDGIGRETYATVVGNYDTYLEIIMSSPAGKFIKMIYNDIRIIR